MNAMENHQQKQAENLFLNTDKSQKEIAFELGIDPKTLYRWINQGHWRELKSATRRMPSVLVENIYAQLDDLNYNISKRECGSRNPAKDESLTISRLVNCINKVQKQTSQGQNIEFMMNFIDYVRPLNEDLAKTLTEYGSGFLKGSQIKGFHPYDIEYDNVMEVKQTTELHDISLSFGEGRGEASLAPYHNPNQLELPFPPTAPLCQPLSIDNVVPNNTSLSFGEGRGEASHNEAPIGHESGIENFAQNPAQPTENQPEEPKTPETKMPEMPENNFPENRASTEGEQEAPQPTNCVSLSFGEGRGEASLAQDEQPNNSPQPRKKKQNTEYPMDPKLIYPGSGVHYRRSTRKTLTKEEYDALFRNDEQKNKRRNNKW